MSAVCACSPPSLSLFPPSACFPHLKFSLLHSFLSCFRHVCCDTRTFSHMASHTDMATHSAELHKTQGTIPLWPKWLITFNKENRDLLVWINLFRVLVQAAVTSNFQTLCGMKLGPFSPLAGPTLTMALHFNACLFFSLLPSFFVTHLPFMKL